MIKCKDIAEYIEEKYPVGLACDWDNVGLLVGSGEREIKKVLIALDNDEHVTAEAEEIGADMIITHHPIMFEPIKRLTVDDPQQRMLIRLCRTGICHYAAHTNMDCAEGGLNDYLAEKLGLKNTSVLDITAPNVGFGRMADLDGEKTLSDMLELCEKSLGLGDVRYVGDLQKSVKRVAVNSGSGAFALNLCIKNGVDLLITGDLKYTPAREAYENGIAVIDAGHYGTEIIFTELMQKYLTAKFPELTIAVSEANVPVLKTHTAFGD